MIKTIPPRTRTILALVGMAGFYFGTLTWLGGGWNFAWQQFSQFWYLVVPIILTFVAQVYLSTKSTWIIGPTSAVSMAACCAHHVADLLPFLGLFSAASFLTRFQIPIMSAALVLNLVGLVYLWYRSSARM